MKSPAGIRAHAPHISRALLMCLMFSSAFTALPIHADGIKEKLCEADASLSGHTDIGGVRVKFDKQNEKFLRYETWNLEPKVGGKLGPVGVNAQNSVEVQFVRFFDEGCEAKKAGIIKRNDIPVDAESALSKTSLEPGEYVSYRSSMVLSVGASAGRELGLAEVSVGASYRLRGQFQIQLYRLSDTRYRMRASVLHAKGREAKFDVSILDMNTLAERVIGSQVLNGKISAQTGRLAVFDYEYDLNDLAARQAFDEALVSFRDVIKGASKTSLGNKQLRKEIDALELRLLSSDSLFAERGDRSPVQRSAEARVKFATSEQRLGIDLGVLKFDAQTDSVTQVVSMRSEAGASRHFMVETYGSSRDLRLVRIRKNNQDLETTLIFNLVKDRSGVIGFGSKTPAFEEMNLRYKGETNLRMSSDPAVLARKLNLILPESYHSQVGAWISRLPRANGSFTTEIDVSLRQEGLQALEQLTPVQIAAVVDNFVNLTRDTDTYAFFNVQRLDEARESLKRGLTKLLDGSAGANGINDRRRAFSLLMINNEIFAKAGAGIMTRLAQVACRSNIESCLSVGVRRSSGDTEDVRAFIGTGQASPQVREFLEYRNQILNNDYDPSLAR